MTKSQIIFMDGKERALKSLFTTESFNFSYLAVGYSGENNGFQEPESESSSNGFNELQNSDYYRVPLSLYGTPEKDPDTGKVLVRFAATLNEDNIKIAQSINQIAIVDSATIDNTHYYAAATFADFTKSEKSSITFIVGFRL